MADTILTTTSNLVIAEQGSLDNKVRIPRARLIVITSADTATPAALPPGRA